MTKLSSKIGTATASASGGYFHIILPYLTGWKSWAISFRRLFINTILSERLYDLSIGGSYSIAMEADSYLEKMFFLTVSAVDVKIGTTLGGNEILDTISVNGFQEVELNIYYETASTVYITYSGGALKAKYSFFNEFFELI